MCRGKSSFFLVILLLETMLLSFGCAREGEKNAESIARTASDGVGIVGSFSSGTKGAPIIILEENHASRAGQIQHAITLVRLHEKNGLKNIALEGYLFERPEIKIDWFVKATKGEPSTREDVAIKLLGEGEISCAEFMKLIYDDIALHPIEKIGEYITELDYDAAKSPIIHLFKIAEKSLKNEDIEKLQSLQKEIETLPEGKEKQNKIKEMLEYIMSVDPWVQERYKLLQDRSIVLTSERQKGIMEEIKEKASKLSIQIDSKDKLALERNIKFLADRTKASKTMSLNVGKIGNKKGTSIVAMVIGAAHTDTICSLFKDSKSPYAVVRPLSFHNGKGDLIWDMVEKKYDRFSVYTEGFMEIINSLFPPRKLKKFEPVINEPWFQAKSEIYTYTGRFVKAVFGPPPMKPPEPPYGFAAGDFDGEWVSIDPNRVEIIYDDENTRLNRAIFFPVTLNYKNPENRREIWVKAVQDTDAVLRHERMNTEEKLMEELKRVQSEEKTDKKVEDLYGRVQMSINVLAAIGENRDIVKNTSLIRD